MIKSAKGILLSISAIAMLAAAISTTPVSAAENTSPEITLSPAKTTLPYKLSVDSTYDESFKLINSGQSKATIQITATPYSVQDAAYTPDYSKYNTYNQLSRWISFPKSTYTLEPGEDVSVKYQIKTPASMPDGDQYAMLMASMSSDRPNQSGNKVQTKSRVGIKLLAHTNGETDENVTVDLPDIPAVVIGNKHDIHLDFHNDGNVDYNSEYTVRVTGVVNKRELLNKSNTTQVLPDTTRSLSISWMILQNIGLYRVDITASTTAGVVTTTKNVLALTPLGLIALVLLVIIIIVIILRMVIKPRQKRSKLRRPT